ncbi:MAG: endo-1,4-beta-xylanase [Planctomyces sp.]|jgi:hypothetical protein
MGAITFQVARPDLLLAGSDLSLIDFLLYDGRVLPTRAALNGNVLTCERLQSESGQIRIPWPRFDGRTQVVHSTSLRESSEPYDLELELARGQLSRLRNQHHAWTTTGLQTTGDVEQMIVEAHRAFRTAILRTEAPEVSAAAALVSMDLSARATEMLCSLYTDQRLGFRRMRASHLPVSLGGRLEDIPQNETAFLETFNSVLIDIPWNQLEPRDGEYNWDKLDRLVEWSVAGRLTVMAGPLLDLCTDRMPRWLKTWSGDLINLQSFMSDFVETVVSRYVGQIRHWEIIAGANCGGIGDLNEEQRMNLAARSVEAARQVDEHVHISLRVIQPWGEYLSSTSNRLAPIQFIDTLRRCGVRIDEINLEIRAGSDPTGSLLRDPLSLSQLLDHWSLLQIPINVMIAAPALPEAQSSAQEHEQALWLQSTISMCLSKERVVGAYYLFWQDSQDLTRPSASTGLNRLDGTARPALETIRGMRQLYWGN